MLKFRTGVISFLCAELAASSWSDSLKGLFCNSFLEMGVKNELHERFRLFS